MLLDVVDKFAKRFQLFATLWEIETLKVLAFASADHVSRGDVCSVSNLEFWRL